MTTQIVFNIDPKIKAKAMQRAKRVGVPIAVILRLVLKEYGEGRFFLDVTTEQK